MKPPQPARAAAVQKALVAALAAVNTANTFGLILGPFPGEIGQGDAIAVGVGDSAVSVTRERQEGLGRAYVETCRVICSAWSWAGDTDIGPHLDRVAELVTLVATVLANNPTLGGACDQAELAGEQEWVNSQSGGATVSAGFVVACKTVV